MQNKSHFIVYFSILLGLACGGNHIQDDSTTSSDTNGGTKPVSGLSGTISVVRTSADYEELAHSIGDAKWSEGEAIVLRNDKVSEQDAKKEIANAGGEVVPIQTSFPYYLVRSQKIRQRWQGCESKARTERTVSDQTKAERKEVHRLSAEFVRTMKTKRHLFKRVSHNYIRKRSGDAINPKQWALTSFDLPNVWNTYGHGSKDVTVAVLDTGELKNHPNLQDNFRWSDGYDFVNDQLDGDNVPGPDNDPTEPATSNASFHGTHVAGIIAANPSGSLNVNGVAGATSILPVRVLGADGGSDYDIAQGILYAAGLLAVKGKKLEQRADIINMSLGGAGESTVLEDAIEMATAAGVIVVVAAGNEGTNLPSFPAAYPEVISVGALGPGKTYAKYSNYGVNVDIMAPGGAGTNVVTDGILSSWVNVIGSTADPTIDYMSGTSMASPFIAGVVALIKSVNKDIGLPDTRKVLYENSTLDGLANCNEHCGRGAPDLSKLMEQAKNLEPSGVKIQLAQDWVVTTPGNPSAKLQLTNVGKGELTFIKDEQIRIRSNGAVNWLTVQQTLENNSIVLSFDVDKSKVGKDAKAVIVDISTNAEDIIVNGKGEGKSNKNGVVEITVAYQPEDTINVVLIDASNDQRKPVAWASTAKSKNWAYHFDPSKQGEYYIFAGNDANHDGVMCGAGDLCGAYPSLSSPKKLSLQGVALLKDLNFGVQSNGSSGAEIAMPKN